MIEEFLSGDAGGILFVTLIGTAFLVTMVFVIRLAIFNYRFIRENAPPWLKEFHKTQDSCFRSIAMALVLLVLLLIAFGFGSHALINELRLDPESPEASRVRFLVAAALLLIVFATRAIARRTANRDDHDQ